MSGIIPLLQIIVLSILSVPLTAHAANDDLFIQSRIDHTSMNWLIDKTRLLMSHAQIKDGLTGTAELKEDSNFDLAALSNDPNYKKSQEVITQLFGVDFKTAKLRLRIPKIYYIIATVHATAKSFQVNDPVLSLQATAELQGIDIGLDDGVQLDVMFQNPKTKVMESYLTVSVDPTTGTLPKELPPATFDISFDTIHGQSMNYKLKSYNLDGLPGYLKSHESDIIYQANATKAPLTVDQIRVNPIIVKLGALTRTVQFEDFKPLIQKRMNTILGQVIGIVGDSLKTTLGPLILNTAFSLSTRSAIEVSSESIYTRYQTAQFEQPLQNQLKLDIIGDMCTQALYNQVKSECIQKTPVPAPVRIIQEADQEKAKNEVTAKLAQGEADVALSASEEYLNRILKTSADAHLMDDMLKENNLILGEKGMFVVFNQATKTPDLYLDLIYSGEGKGVENLFVNERHSLHFPLRMSTSLSFENRDGIPYMILKIEKLMSNIDEIMHGVPEYNLTSELTLVLKKKVAKKILKMADKIENKTAMEMSLPMFQDIGLEKTWYEVSSHGRVNLYFKLQ